MELATENHLAKLRQMLTRRAGELRAEISAADLKNRDRESSVPKVRDRQDEASDRSLSEIHAAERQRDVEELTLVEAALRRLDAGGYGDCKDCGQPIALARLLVHPAAERCAQCQTAVEARTVV